MRPTSIPRVNAPNITAKASYMYTLLLCCISSPMALRTPYSHRFSLMFAVVEISKRKKERVSAMKPMIDTKIWRRERLDCSDS